MKPEPEQGQVWAFPFLPIVRFTLTEVAGDGPRRWLWYGVFDDGTPGLVNVLDMVPLRASEPATCPDCTNGLRMPLLFGMPYPCSTCNGTGKVAALEDAI